MMSLRCRFGLHAWGFWFRLAILTDRYVVKATRCQRCRRWASKVIASRDDDPR